MDEAGGTRRLLILARRAAAVAALAVLWWTVGLGYGWGGAHKLSTRDEAIEKLQKFGRVGSQPDSPGIWVELKGRRVTDSILDLLGMLTDVNRLTLTDTRVTAAGLAKLQRLLELRVLIVDGADLIDQDLVEITRLKSLECLALLDTRVDGTGLGCLKALPRLDTLYIEGPIHTASGLADLGRLKALYLLDVRLEDPDMAFLKRLPDLESLSLRAESLTLKGLGNLVKQQHLKYLDPAVHGTEEDLERLVRAHPGVKIIGIACGTGQAKRESELAERRVRHQGLTGRLRLACRDFLR